MKAEDRTKLVWTGIASIVGATALLAMKAPRRYAIKDKVVLVTGGSRGLGLLMAREFISLSAKVAVCARSEEELAKVRDEFALLGTRFLAIRCDVSDKAQVDGLVEAVNSRLGPIDVLVNNAGTIRIGAIENQTLDDFHQAMQTIFWGAVYTTVAVLPGMKKRQAGRIVNIASIGSKIGVPHLLPYCASKFALLGFSKGLRAELRKDGIWVTTVIPGLMRTGSPRNTETTGQHKKEYSWFILGDSLPGISIDAGVAAKKIVEACIAGTGEIVLGTPAKIAAAVDALAPDVMSAMLGATNEWILPGAAGSETSKKGFASENSLTHSFLTRLTRIAELQNNEV